MDRFTGLLGLAAILLVSVLFSKHRRAIRPGIIVWGLALQFTFALIVFHTPAGWLFKKASDGVNAMLGYSAAGAKFVFGDQLGDPAGSLGFIFAFQVLPIIIFIASFFAILYYFGVMQIFVRGMAFLMQRVDRKSTRLNSSHIPLSRMPS